MPEKLAKGAGAEKLEKKRISRHILRHGGGNHGFETRRDHLKALEALTALHIWTDSSLPGGLPGWSLSAVFRKHIQIALLGGGKQWAVYNALEKDKHGRDAAFLDQYAAERWECVLHFMVGCHTTEGISVDAVRTLLHAGLMKSEEGEGSSPLITMDGFQFLLMDTASQVWHFVLQYLDTLESRGLNLVESLTFLFQISFLTLGKPVANVRAMTRNKKASPKEPHSSASKTYAGLYKIHVSA
ncbi:general transcription factor IIH subunit 4-like [Rhipicephalus microplus]|uniref:general transcription factor IIH subunit 4-like n=1 Tax=Rhipicephalus microplus TaxID=6941 RepID=UPI003F6C32B6